jgi:hypothetical protein
MNTDNAEKAKVVILDDNELSLACYAEEYPENWKAMTDTKQNANRSEDGRS